MILGLSTLDIILLITLGATVILGSLIFFLAGIYRVKKNTVMLIEKAEQFYNIYPEGTYFFMPVIYKRKGIYTIVPMEKDIHIEGLRDLILTFQVIDVKKYHYYSGDVEKKVRETYLNNPEINEDILKDALDSIGIKYINIRAK